MKILYQLTINPKCLSMYYTISVREILVDWIIEVSNEFKLLENTLYLSVNYLDRFLSIKNNRIAKSKLQLVGKCQNYC